MLLRPLLRPGHQFAVLPGEGSLVLSDTGEWAFSGAAYEYLLPLLDGTHTGDDLVELLEDRVEVAEAYYALSRLESLGLIVEAPTGDGAREEWAFRVGLEPDGAAVVHPDQPGPSVEWVNHSSWPIGSLARALERCGVAAASPADLVIVVADDYLAPELDSVNRTALQSGQPWLLVRPGATVIWIGPWIVPGRSACWSCLEYWIRRNRVTHEFLRERGHPPQGHGAPGPSRLSGELTAGLLALELRRPLDSAGNPDLCNQLLSVDLRGRAWERHGVRRRPQCAACGDPALYTRGAQAEIDVRPDSPVLTSGTAWRAGTAEQFLARHQDLVSPITGVVPWLRELPVENGSPIHVVGAGPALVRPWGTLDAFLADLRGQSSGKGVTAAEARAAALGEGLERAAGLFHGDEPRVRATLNSLGADGIHPNACMLVSDAQYRERDVWNARGVATIRMPAPLDPDRELDWTPIWSLTRGTRRYLPTSFLYYHHPEAGADSPCLVDSNGCAAGGTREEAILAGLLELVERDSVALWWYNRARRPAIDLATCDDGFVHTTLSAYRARQREIWVLDLVTDLEIPVYVAVSVHPGLDASKVLIGLGAHLDPLVALRRALTELNQMLVVTERFEGREQELPPELQWWLGAATVANQPYLRPGDGPRPPLPAGPAVASAAEALRQCQRQVEARGVEVLVLDQTRPDLAVPTVRVVAPGLRPFWARYAPGRLYDVPLSLGWLARPLSETELNPVPMFL